MITQGLLLWPYFTGARLIAPYVVEGKAQEYKTEAGEAILVLLIISTLVTAFHVRRCSSGARRVLMENALLIGTIGVVERIWSAMVGEVR